jgi:O-antigen/teichoic acid export membrane protein
MPLCKAYNAIRWLIRFTRNEAGLVYTSLGSTTSAILGAFFWVIFASILEVDNYGLANYYISLASIFATLGIMGLNTTVTTYLAKGEEHVVYEANSLTLISGLFSALILSTFQWISGLLSAASIFFSMTLAEVLGRRNYREYALLSIGQRTTQITLSVLLYLQFGIFGIVTGYFLGFLIFSYRFIDSIKNFTLKIDGVKEKRNFTMHSYGVNLIGNLSASLDKIVIGTLFGYYTLGLYQLGFQFFMFLSIIPGTLQQYLLPEESSGENKSEIKLVGFVASILIAIAMILISPHLVHTFFPTFTAAIPMVQLISLALIPLTISSVLNATFLGQEKSKNVFTAGVVYLFSLVMMLTLVGKLIGTSGLALAVVTAQTLQAIYLLAQAQICRTRAQR